VFDLPRSARLALWAAAVLRGSAGPDQALREVTADDEPHEVVIDDVCGGLPEMWAFLARNDVEGLRLVLPAPGDALGLPGPPTFNESAVDAGEALVADGPAGAWGVVPDVETYGSEYEQGFHVTWRVSPVERRRVTDLGSVSEAEFLLRNALREATEELSKLDLTSWSGDPAERLRGLREAPFPDGALPRGLSPRAVRVLAMSLRVRAIVEIAGADDGGSVSLFEATTRRRTLDELERITRHALVAAVNEPVER
jgi:hypothetical protein